MSVLILADLHTTLERFILGDRQVILQAPTESEIQFAIQHALELLGARGESLSAGLYELRLRVALHFAPIDAISYDRKNPRPRHRIIRDHLQGDFQRTGPIVEQLARDTAKVLDEWDATRVRVAANAEELLRRQCGRCAHCGVVLWPTPRPHRESDPFKPYVLAADELLSPEVDHIEPISGFGTNRSENLQVLCRLCNQGKGDGLGLSVRAEAQYAATSIEDIPGPHRMRMFYYVLDRYGRNPVSGRTARDCELTIRPIRVRGGYVRSNLTVATAEEA